jgi:hypothetical protein
MRVAIIKFQTWAIPGGGDIVRNMDVTPDGNPVLANSLVNEVGLVEIKLRATRGACAPGNLAPPIAR